MIFSVLQVNVLVSGCVEGEGQEESCWCTVIKLDRR